MGARPRLETDDVGLGEFAASYRRSQIEGTIRWLVETGPRLLAGKESE